MSTEVKIKGKWLKLGEEVKHGGFWWLIAAIHHDGKVDVERTSKDVSIPSGIKKHYETIFEDSRVAR